MVYFCYPLSVAVIFRNFLSHEVRTIEYARHAEDFWWGRLTDQARPCATVRKCDKLYPSENNQDELEHLQILQHGTHIGRPEAQSRCG